ncbi:MAG: ABC transporter permease [Gorillibacterium sp.]|nr:ABC transporter permease [Gorillibacterium sp.]
MNLFWRECRAQRKSLIIWSIGMLFMVASGMGKYAALGSSGQSMKELFAELPKSLRALLGIGSFDLSSAMGYYGVLFFYLALMAAIHASMLGANVIAKEERDHTSEFLLTKPISRTRIISFKLLSAASGVLILNLITLLISIAEVSHYSKGEAVTGDIVVLYLGLFAMQLIFLLMGAAIAAVSRRSKLAAGAAASVLLITFFLSILMDLSDKLAFLEYLTPFKYFSADKVLVGGGFESIFIVLSVLIIAVLLKVTYGFYQKRDMHG